MHQRTGDKQHDALTSGLHERVDALSSRRLMALTAFFVLTLGALLFSKYREEVNARAIETELRVAGALSSCASALDLAVVTGASVRTTLANCHPGGATALYHMGAGGSGSSVLAAYGATDINDLSPAVASTIDFAAAGSGVLDLPTGPARAAWRPLDSNDALIALAPARDIFQRSPLWITYTLLIGAIGLVCACLMAAFIRQSTAARDAARAIDVLSHQIDALGVGRTGLWRFDAGRRSLMLSRTVLEPMGLGRRDRDFTMRELTALIHPEDLRSALALITGAPTGISEGAIRMRNPEGGWSRLFLRTDAALPRHQRYGIAVDLNGAGTFLPTTALAEARLKDAIENIPEAFILWDAQGRLAAWNGRFAKIFGLSSSRLKAGMSVDQLVEQAQIGASIIERFLGPDSAIDQQTVEIDINGNHWLKIARRQTAEGGIVCVASNVTEMKKRAQAQKKRERKLKALVSDLEASKRELSETTRKYALEKHRAEDASRIKSEFLANMSHELRTPLNAINGFSEIMQSELYGPLGDPKYREYVDDILASGQHLLTLIDDVLDMSKIESGRKTLSMGRVELERVLVECGRFVSKRARDAGINLVISVVHAPAAYADTRAVKQITLNLLSNAIKFTPRGGEITLTAEADLDGVTVIVADSGVGIEKANLERLGAPFEIIEDQLSKRQNGSGLGLALSKSLIEMMGGILAIASQPGKGTVVCASLPRRRDAQVRLPQFMRLEGHVLTAPAQTNHGARATPRTPIKTGWHYEPNSLHTEYLSPPKKDHSPREAAE